MVHSVVPDSQTFGLTHYTVQIELPCHPHVLLDDLHCHISMHLFHPIVWLCSITIYIRMACAVSKLRQRCMSIIFSASEIWQPSCHAVLVLPFIQLRNVLRSLAYHNYRYLLASCTIFFGLRGTICNQGKKALLCMMHSTPVLSPAPRDVCCGCSGDCDSWIDRAA